MADQVRNKIIETLQKAETDMTLFRLKKIVTESFSEDSFSDCLAELVDAGDIIYTAKGIALRPTTLEGFILHTTAGTTKNILLRYFNGLPVAELSATELRALIKDVFRDRPKLNEDRYKKAFRTYAFPEQIFVAVYNSNIATYRYLLHTTSRGKQDWRTLRFDEKAPADIRQSVIELMRSEGLSVNGEHIDCTPRAIATYLLKSSEGAVEEIAVLEKYKQFLSENAPLPSGLEMESGAFFRMLYASANVIRNSNNTVRYRLENPVKDIAALKKLKLGSYKNQLISADIIFDSKETVLRNANILNSHELFWLLKKHSTVLSKYAYTATHCPFVRFGEATHEQQLLELLKEMSPVSLEELANEYQKRYGLKSSTIKVKYRAAIMPYYYDGVYNIKTRLLTSKQKKNLESKLGATWYYFDDVRELFRNVIGKNYEAYLNSSNFATLGYRETSQVVYASKYSSVEQCFRDVFLSQDIFEVEERLWHLPQVYNMLSGHAEALDIIEYSPRRFIAKKCLARQGIHKKTLRKYTEAVCNAVSDEAYFTIESLKRLGIESPIDDLGFDDTFYYSILRQSNKIQAKPVAGKHIFRKTKTGKLTLPDFLEYLVVESGTIDIYDFSAIIADEYGLILDVGYIRFLIRETCLFYDTISEKIFPDYETYLEEI